MRADVVLQTLVIGDPLSARHELDAAYAWWDDEVWAWREARGLVTDEERRARADRFEFVQMKGSGEVCVSYRA